MTVHKDSEEGWHSSWVLTVNRTGHQGGGAKGQKRGGGGRKQESSFVHFPGHRLPFCSWGLAPL